MTHNNSPRSRSPDNPSHSSPYNYLVYKEIIRYLVLGSYLMDSYPAYVVPVQIDGKNLQDSGFIKTPRQVHQAFCIHKSVKLYTNYMGQKT